MSKLIKNKYPILEFDSSKRSVIEPSNIIRKIDIPKNCVICFFREVLDKLIEEGKLTVIKNLKSEMGLNPVYEIEAFGRKAALIHPGIGAPLCAGTLEEVIALGCENFIACGGAGVLDKDITAGQVILPTAAIRDEGTSYHYIEPSREIHVNNEALEVLIKTLDKHGCKYIKGKTWTTDAFFRETTGKVELRKSEGCLTVEMETAAFFAVAEFRGVKFAQMLYGGDDVSCDEWDPRRSPDRNATREKIFWLAVEACMDF